MKVGKGEQYLAKIGRGWDVIYAVHYSRVHQMHPKEVRGTVL